MQIVCPCLIGPFGIEYDLGTNNWLLVELKSDVQVDGVEHSSKLLTAIKPRKRHSHAQ